MPSRIIGFYNCTESDHRGRYLRELQEWPDDQLESVPDYIQWLFPLPVEGIGHVQHASGAAFHTV